MTCNFTVTPYGTVHMPPLLEKHSVIDPVAYAAEVAA